MNSRLKSKWSSAFAPRPDQLIRAPRQRVARASHVVGNAYQHTAFTSRLPLPPQENRVAQIALDVNGTTHTIDADPDMPLLYALRNDLGLNNPHFGCGLAQCGACTVHLNGEAVRSCVTPLSAIGNGKVTTLAGLGTPEKPHPLQAAYIQEEVPQCGYCINGWIMTAAALLNKTPRPSDAQIKDALTGLKCRCGTHLGIMRAVKRASEMMG